MLVDLTKVFPAPAGMNRLRTPLLLPRPRIPRTRGDEPCELRLKSAKPMYSPHPRG